MAGNFVLHHVLYLAPACQITMAHLANVQLKFAGFKDVRVETTDALT